MMVCNRHGNNILCASGQNLIDCPSYTSFWFRVISVADSASRKAPLNKGLPALNFEVGVMLCCIRIALQSDKWTGASIDQGTGCPLMEFFSARETL